jgi:hypothetical protein
MSRKLAGLLLATLMPLASLAQEAPPAPPVPAASTAHRHLGFFIRPELGFGYFDTKASQGGVDAEIKGSAGHFGIAIGGAVTENFILAGQIWDYVASKPTYSLGSSGNKYSQTLSGNAGLVGYGLLVNWYFQPSNLYLGFTPSFTRLVEADQGDSSTSDWGFGVRATFGKEWWVSDHWGLGLAASLALSSNKGGGSGSPTWTTGAFGLSFSATYN